MKIRLQWRSAARWARASSDARGLGAARGIDRPGPAHRGPTRARTAGGWRSRPDDFAGCLLVSVRGRLRAAAGEAHLGVRDLLAAGARLLRCACLTPSLGWRSRAGLLAHRLDRHDEATRLIEDEYALARSSAHRGRSVWRCGPRLWIAPPARQVELLDESAEQLRRRRARSIRPHAVRSRRGAAPLGLPNPRARTVARGPPACA